MNNNERLYVDLHVLQTVPPSCVNRDDTGSPKTAVYGGVTRARVSSQAWKHAMRLRFKELYADDEDFSCAYRTKDLIKMLAKEMCRIAPQLGQPEAKTLAKDVWSLLGIEEEPKTEKVKTLTFVSEKQIRNIAGWAVERPKEIAESAAKSKKDKADPLTKELEDLMIGSPSLDQILFGRMVASRAILNYDAAAQVAHAISTHAVENEFDYFTAVDDCSPEDNAGAGHLGTVEFNSSTLYRYATVNVAALRDTLGDRTPEAVRAFAEAFIRSMPTGKQNTFANRTRPDAVYVTVRRDQPVALTGAFEKPIAAGDDGYVAASVRALADYAKETYADFVAAPVLALGTGKGLEALEVQPCSVDALLDTLESYLSGDEEQR